MSGGVPESMPRVVKPDPDPTTRTVELLAQSIENIQDQFDVRAEIRQREHATLQELIEALLEGAKAITEERFASINVQLVMVERQRVEQKKDTKDAVDAALIAQKEAVQEQTIASGLSIAKSEAATAKQLDQQSVTFTTAISGVSKTVSDQKDANNVAFADLKERMTALEFMKRGATENRTDTRAVVAIFAGLFGGAIIALLTKVLGG